MSEKTNWTRELVETTALKENVLLERLQQSKANTYGFGLEDIRLLCRSKRPRTYGDSVVFLGPKHEAVWKAILDGTCVQDWEKTITNRRIIVKRLGDD